MRAGLRQETGPEDGLDVARPLRILVVNWQDRQNPRAGGAEVHLHEIFRRIAARGHHIRFLVSGWSGCAGREEADGILVHRVGSRHSFPFTVRGAYQRRLSSERFDVIVEDINKLPLYTPLWVRPPVVALVPHLFGTTAFKETSWPVAATVWSAEKAMRWVYRNVRFQAISRSTADDLVRRGFQRDQIQVVYPGLDHGIYCPDPKVAPYESPTAVYVGRLKRYKGLDVVLRSLAILRERGVAMRLLVAGRGSDRQRLQELSAELGIDSMVRFLGYVSEDKKLEMLRRAWINVYPSPKEGWGLTNVEAAACGTPTIASDSPGLRESVAQGESGCLVPHENAMAWADQIECLSGDATRRHHLGEGALRHASRFSWQRAAVETERWLVETRKRAIMRGRAGALQR